MINDELLNLLENTYKSQAIALNDLAKIICNVKREEAYYEDPEGYSIPGLYKEADAYYDKTNKYLKITVNRVPEKVELYRNIGTKYHESTKFYWMEAVRYALNKTGNDISFSDCVVLINICYKDLTWDVDNHTINFIINAIKKKLLIPDDDWRYLQYMVKGSSVDDNSYRTEIYIIEQKCFPEVYLQISKT